MNRTFVFGVVAAAAAAALVAPAAGLQQASSAASSPAVRQRARGRAEGAGKELGLPRNRSEDPDGCGVVWFYHLPKTGGESYKKYLERNQTGDMFYLIEDYSKLRSWWTAPDGLPRKLKEVDDAVKRVRPGRPYMKVHHHHGAPGLEAMLPSITSYRRQVEAAGCNFTLATVLREPVDRTLSAFWYNTRSQPNVTKVLKTFDRMLVDDNSDNEQLRYLINGIGCVWSLGQKYCPPHDAHLPGYGHLHRAFLDRGLKLLEAFDVVGVTPRLEQFAAKVDARMGWRHLAMPTENKNLRRFDNLLTEKQRLAVSENCKFDQELYQRALQLAP
eukprot:TRINITY_DN55653_c0_g1_i1.p1 TRINITY_DN55653_c0_g1~~TRINITY_DN55653_c0_g1_i1.p1  ORF type:complete len:349 (+),score=67.44 TRINITY_DN55653_c0_g1_i1:63-1049(+)